MSDLFGNSTLPGWQMFTPQSYGLAAAPANAQIGKSFSEAFQGAKQNQLGQAQMGLQRDKLIEDARQFNIMHPDPTKPWSTPNTGWNTPSDVGGGWDSAGADVGGGNFSSSDWQGFEEGGRPPVGQPSIVGEGGPEVFVPDQPGTIVPNAQIGMAYDRNGTGNITPTGITSTSSVGEGVSARAGAGWNGEQKPGWLNAPAPNWRATNALDAIGKVMQATSFDDLSKITAANPEGVMYPQFQSALAEKSQILQRGEAIAHQQKVLENNNVGSKIILNQGDKFNNALASINDPETVAAILSIPLVKTAVGDIPGPRHWAEVKKALEIQKAAMAFDAAKNNLVATKLDEKGTTYGQPRAGSDVANYDVKTFYDENNKPSFEALVDKTTGKVQHSIPMSDKVPPDVKAQQANIRTKIEATQHELQGLLTTANSTSATADAKATAARAALGARTQLEKLLDERVKLSTNWMTGAAAPKGSAPVSKVGKPGDPLGLF